MSAVLNSLVPIFGVIAAGALMRRAGFLSREFFAGANRLCYYVALPVLLFHKIARAEFSTGAALNVFYVMLGATLASAVVAYAACAIFGVKSTSRGAFVQASFRGNLLYVGLPAILYTLRVAEGAQAAAIETTAILAIAPLVPIYNVLAVLVLSRPSGDSLKERLKGAAVQMASNPLIIACVVGIIYSLSGLEIPPPLARGLEALSGLALPLALLAVGSSLSLGGIRGSMAPATGAAFIKLAVAPLLGLAGATLIGLDRTMTCTALLYLACPTAVASFVLTEQLGGDWELSGNSIVLSTLGSVLSLGIIVYAYS